MDSPVAIVKSQLNLGTILRVTIGFIIVAAIFNALGLTDWLLYPWDKIKAKANELKAKAGS